MFLNLILIFTLLTNSLAYKLKQVVVLSRHNIRTPLMTNLELLSPKKWPSWNMDPGSLTPKGHLLERGMGKYFSDWMIEEKLFDDNCPNDQVLMYANTLSRTRETAKSFAEGAFGDCVSVYYKNTTEYDPIFTTIVRNTSVEFKEAVIKEINKQLNSTNLRDAYLELNRIVDFGNSPYCKTKMVCDLNEIKSEFVYKINAHPDISGGVTIGWSLVDWFLMEFYDGMALENVAWGQIKTTKQWESLMLIVTTYLETRLKSKILARDLASPLLEYITDIFKSGKKKLYILIGHDINITVLMLSLSFKDYILHEQLEKTPIGGKLVFQKWYDEENKQDLLRVNYVYLSTEQIRSCVEVSVQNPPQWQILEMENCVVDANGFCLWSDFISILNQL